jgi:GNAT superfamily N-acetyltransferase
MMAAHNTHRRIERLAFRAWPCLESQEFDGWVLRFANGYTKRANSANPHFGSTLPVEEKIARCEAEYAARGLPTIFRLTPFSQPPELDSILEQANYTVLDHSLVLSASLDRPLPLAGNVRSVDIDAWIDAFDRLKQPDPATCAPHRRIIETAEGLHRFAVAESDGAPVACGLGVRVDDAVGLFDLITTEPHRQRGFGSAVVGAILRWAHGGGARTAFLQVHSENEAALRLYERFGFAIAYPYWYRVAPEGPQGHTA